MFLGGGVHVAYIFNPVCLHPFGCVIPLFLFYADSLPLWRYGDSTQESLTELPSHPEASAHFHRTPFSSSGLGSLREA